MGWWLYVVLGWLALVVFFWCLLVVAARADRRDASAQTLPHGGHPELHMIVAADTRARHHHGRLEIFCGRSRVRRPFRAHRRRPFPRADRCRYYRHARRVQRHAARRELMSALQAPEPFRCDIVDEPGRVRVAPVGELDLATAEPLVQTIRVLRRSSVTHLILDLRRVSFIDSSGVHVAWDLHTETADDGLRLELVPGPPDVQRIFELTGTHDRLPFVTPERPTADPGETEPLTG